MKKVISLLMCLCFISIMFQCESTHTYAEEKEIEELHILTDEELSLLYTCKEDVHNDTCLSIDQKDAELLMKIAYCEDHTNIESQAAVIACVLNRVADPSFPNTVEGVIRQKGQFSTVSSGTFDKTEPNADSHYALALIESGQVDSDALFFEACSAKNTWQSKHLVYVSTVGGTRYYR